MKKLFSVVFALALLMITSHGAFAMCNNNNQVSNQPGDAFDSNGWCIDGYGTLSPHLGRGTNSQFLSTMGSYRVPVSYDSVMSTQVSLNSQQSGLVMVDSGGVTSDTLKGFGSKFVLPQCSTGTLSSSTTGSMLTSQGMQFTLTVSSQSTSTLDTLNVADTFMNSISGTGSQMGDSLKSTGQAGDSVTVVCADGLNHAGIWVITSMKGSWTNGGAQ